ncbi:MAG TPA: NlpC/P60 family protein [Ferruginibacter sp.]|nr:NlpC/P60 family protein [Ferruginibacter sp.]
MNKFLPITLFTILSTAFHFSAQAQPSLQFIDGIELKSDMVEYGITLPTATEIKVPAEKKKIFSPISSSLKIATEACKSLQFKYAQLMDVDIEDITNLTMFHFVEEWWNTRYRYGGSTKKGIDCSALTGILLGSVYGLALPRTAREQFAASEKIKRENLQEGDLVFFNTRGGVSHVGVYLANDYFVHASVSSGVTISNLNETYYSSKFIGSGRMTTCKENIN